MPGDLCTAPGIISLSLLPLATDIDVTLGTSGLWLGILTRAGGTATLSYSFLAAVHGSMDSKILGYMFWNGSTTNYHNQGEYILLINLNKKVKLV